MHRSLVVIVTILVFISCTHLNKSGTVYHIDPAGGNDKNEGTIEKPWKTFLPVSLVIFKPGDQLLLKGGEKIEGTLVINDFLGTALKPLVISSYGSGRAIIESGDSAAIRITASDHIVCENLVVKGSGRSDGNLTDGLLFSQVKNLTIDSVEASGYLFSGIHVKGGSDVTIKQCYAHDNGFCGIYAESGENEYGPDGLKFKTMKNVKISYCTASNNPGCPAITNNHSGSGILMAGIVNGIIEYCEAYENGWDMPREGNGPVGIWAYMSDSVIIQYCFSHHNKTSPKGKDGGGFDFDGGMRYSVMQYNVSEYNEGAGYGIFQYAGATEWTGNIMRYNISYSDGSKNSQAGIYMWYDPIALPMKDFRAYNNTVYSSYGHAVSFEPGNYEDFVFERNLFCLSGEPGTFIFGNQKNAEFTGNTWCSIWGDKISVGRPAEDPGALLKMPEKDLVDLIVDEQRVGNQARINNRVRIHFEK